MKYLKVICLVLGLLAVPLIDRADTAALPWTASAQAPTAFAVPLGKDTTVMTEAAALIDDWKNRDKQMYPMPIRTDTSTLIQTDTPTALGLFGVKITDTHTAGVALISVETSGYEGKILEVSQQRHDAEKRAHMLAYFLEQSAGVSPAPAVTPPPALPMPSISSSIPPLTAASPFAPMLDQLRMELDSGSDESALTTLDTLRAAIVNRQKSAAK